MGLFNKKKEEDAVIENSSVEEVANDKKEVKKSSKKSVKKTVAKSEGVYQGDGQMAYQFIVKPWITEKAQGLMGDNKYIFKLRAGSTKREAKIAVEKLYNVKVESVNIINIPQKKRKFGRFVGKKGAIKKAIVTLKKGNKIEIFE
ncbi:MAG: 50S ribosomal protein L23 [Parcubacteria group bacterium]|jgi:large subunit ribosomal protein L23